MIVAKNTNEFIEDIIWNMPITMALKVSKMSVSLTTGKTNPSFREKYITNKMFDKIEEVNNVK